MISVTYYSSTHPFVALRSTIKSSFMQALGIALVGIVAQQIFSWMACVFFCAATALFIERVAIKAIDLYSSSPVLTGKTGILRFDRRFSKLKIVALAAAIALASISMWAGSIAGIVIGLYCGITINAKQSQILRKQPMVYSHLGIL